MPREGAIVFRDLVGKLDVLNVECDKCGRRRSYPLDRQPDACIDTCKHEAKHHQWLTDDVGYPALAQHLHAVITLMRVARSWAQFKQMLDVAHPRRGDTLQLPLMIDPSAPAQDGVPQQTSLFD